MARESSLARAGGARRGGTMGRRARSEARSSWQAPEADPPEEWVPQTAARRDELRVVHGRNFQSGRSTRSLSDEGIVEAAAKYQIPDDAPAWVAAATATRDTEHLMTLPGFALSRWWMYVA